MSFLDTLIPTQGAIQNLDSSYLCARILKIIDLDNSTNATPLQRYSNITKLAQAITGEITLPEDLLKTIAALAMNANGNDIFSRLVTTVAKLPGKAKTTKHTAPTLPQLSDYPLLIDENNQIEVPAMFQDLDPTDPIQEEVLQEIQPGSTGGISRIQMENALEVLKKKSDLVSPGYVSKNIGTQGGSFGTINPFEDKDQNLRVRITKIFESVSNLGDYNLSDEMIEDSIETALNRCISEAYDYTNNQVSNVASFFSIVKEFEDSTNEYKAMLFEKIVQVITYVNEFDLNSFGLTPQYNQLRLSQIIPNYLLKIRGFLKDTSACSSGKTGTILMAPMITGANVSLIVVENNSYNDFLRQFKSWYFSRISSGEYKIIGKNEFMDLEWKDKQHKYIILLDKAFLARRNEDKARKAKQPTFEETVSGGIIELFVSDEAHNYNGASCGGSLSGEFISDSDPDLEEKGHNNCSRALHVLSIHSKWRLFATATPILNDFTEGSKLLQMLLPYEKTHSVNRFQEKLKTVIDHSKCSNNLLEKASIVHEAMSLVSIQVPKPGITYDVRIVSNDNVMLNPDGSFHRDSDPDPSISDSVISFIRDFEANKKASSSNGTFMWADIYQDEVFFEEYIRLFKKDIVNCLCNEEQIFIYTNQSKQAHEDIKYDILMIANSAGISLHPNEVIIANGDTSKDLRTDARIRGSNGPISTTKLAKMVWQKKAKVIIANNVLSVGFDGLQGTDRISNCGRISSVFLLANPYTDGIKYQLFSRFVRTSGENGTLPNVTFYQPHIWFNASSNPNDVKMFSRNERTNRRIELKKIKADLAVDGLFPEGVNVESIIQSQEENVLAALMAAQRDPQP